MSQSTPSHFSRAIELYRAAFVPLFLVNLVSRLPTFVGSLSDGDVQSTLQALQSHPLDVLLSSLVTYVVQSIFDLWALMAMTRLALAAMRGQKLSVQGAAAGALRYVPALLSASTAGVLIVLGVSALCYAPVVVDMALHGFELPTLADGGRLLLLFVSVVAVLLVVALFATAFVLVLPAIVADDLRGRAAVLRAWHVLRRNFGTATMALMGCDLALSFGSIAAAAVSSIASAWGPAALGPLLGWPVGALAGPLFVTAAVAIYFGDTAHNH